MKLIQSFSALQTKLNFAVPKMELGSAPAVGKKETSHEDMKICHRERVIPGKLCLLLLLLQEEQGARLTFRKESHHFVSSTKEVTAASLQGAYTGYNNFEQRHQAVSRKCNNIMAFFLNESVCERQRKGCRLRNGRHYWAGLCHLTVVFAFESVTEGAVLSVAVRGKNILLGSYKG